MKCPIQRASQRVRRTSAAWSWCGLVDRSLSIGRFARSNALSLTPSIARSLARSIALSLSRSRARSLDRSVDRSLDRSLDRSVVRSVGRPPDRSLDRLPSLTTILVDGILAGFEFRVWDMPGNHLGGRISNYCRSPYQILQSLASFRSVLVNSCPLARIMLFACCKTSVPSSKFGGITAFSGCLSLLSL